MGISGAAIATMVSQMVSFSILLFQCNMQKGCIAIRISRFTPTLKIYGEILHAGLPSFCRQGLASVATVALNFAAGPYGDAAIAVPVYDVCQFQPYRLWPGISACVRF